MNSKLNDNKTCFDLMYEGQVNSIIVIGNSMEPTLMPFWKVKVLHVESARIHTGDIILTRNNGRLICHRVIGKWTDEGKTIFLQKGDNSSSGEIISEEKILGKVIEIRDEKSNIIEDTLREDYKKFYLFWGCLIYNFYKILSIFKRAIFGNKRNRFTAFIWRYFWLFSFLLISITQRKKIKNNIIL